MGIIAFLKKIIEVKGSDLSFLNVGDIIWARRYQTKEEKSKIKKGHQESPYVIIQKIKGKVYGLQCTSNPHIEIKWNMVYYPIGKLNYDMEKNSYINCTYLQELKEIQFVEMIGSLSDYDLNQLKKQLYILINSNFKRKPNIDKKALDFSLGVGDVIRYQDKKYYIDAIKNNKFEVFQLESSSKKNQGIFIDGLYYRFLFSKKEEMKKHETCELLTTFNTGAIAAIREYKMRLEENGANRKYPRKEIQVGAVLSHKDNLFYVQEEKENMITMYQIYPSSIHQNGMADILVHDAIYKTFFDIKKVQKETLEKNYQIKKVASQEEIKYNQNLFYLPKRKRREERKKLSGRKRLTGEKDIDNLIPMVIAQNENNQQYYLIISRNENTIEVVNINDLGDSFYFELEKASCPFQYYRILSKEEYDKYLDKIQQLKDMVEMFQR